MKILKFSALTLLSVSILAANIGCSSQEEASQKEYDDSEFIEKETNSDPDNLVQNGDFSQGKKFWMIFLSHAKADQLFNNGEMEIKIKKPGSAEWSVQPFYDGLSLYKGGVYKYSFDVRSTIERYLEWRIQYNGGDYHAYATNWEKIGPETRHVEYTFTMDQESDFSPRIVFNVGKGDKEPEDMGSHSVFFDNVRLELIDKTNITEIILSTEKTDINLNQIGFLPNTEKTAVVRSKQKVERL